MTGLFECFRRTASTTAFRLSIAASGIFVLLGAVLAALLFWQTNNVLTEQVLASLRNEAKFLKADARSGGTETLARMVSMLSRPEGPGLYLLTDRDGQKLAGNLNRAPPELLNNPNGSVFRYAKAQGAAVADRLAVAIPVDVGPSRRLLIGRDIEDQRRFADTMRSTFILGFGLLSVLGLLAGLAVSRLVLNRMEAITETSRSIMAGDLSQRIPVDGTGGELEALAHNLNDMLERIESLMSGLREVSDNIAHDLKTPLNRLRNAAEAALRDSRGDEAYRKGLEQTIERADELIKIFNALLLVARLEAGPLKESLENFDLGALISDVSELYMPAAEEQGYVLSVEAEPGIWVRANRQLIGQAVSNLIDNAIKYSRGGQPGGAITVRVAGDNGGAFISVGDRGPGIPAEDRARVLKRFVRLEASRTRPGTGLGLSLVAAVARLHHGDVILMDNEPGLKVILRLGSRVRVAAPSDTDVEVATMSAH